MSEWRIGVAAARNGEEPHVVCVAVDGDVQRTLMVPPSVDLLMFQEVIGGELARARSPVVHVDSLGFGPALADEFMRSGVGFVLHSNLGQDGGSRQRAIELAVGEGDWEVGFLEMLTHQGARIVAKPVTDYRMRLTIRDVPDRKSLELTKTELAALIAGLQVRLEAMA